MLEPQHPKATPTTSPTTWAALAIGPSMPVMQSDQPDEHDVDAVGMHDHPLLGLVEPLHPDVTEQARRRRPKYPRKAAARPDRSAPSRDTGRSWRRPPRSGPGRPAGASRGGPRSACPSVLSHHMLKKMCRDAEVHEDRRHEPPDLAVLDVSRPLSWRSALRSTVVGREEAADSTQPAMPSPATFCRRKTTTQTAIRSDGQRAPAQAGIAPEVGGFAKVLAELLVELLLLAADRLGGVGRALRYRGSSG